MEQKLYLPDIVGQRNAVTSTPASAVCSSSLLPRLLPLQCFCLRVYCLSRPRGRVCWFELNFAVSPLGGFQTRLQGPKFSAKLITTHLTTTSASKYCGSPRMI